MNEIDIVKYDHVSFTHLKTDIFFSFAAEIAL
jgi:hypothetical protein